MITDVVKNKIASIDELLDNMPKNNAKNNRKYLEELENTRTIFVKERDIIFTEIKSRYERANNVKKPVDTSMEISLIANLEDKLDKITPYNTFYDKMGLSKIIYDLKHFYKNNLVEINNDISLALDKFKEVGIRLTIKDFNYSFYVTEYMKGFFTGEERDNELLKKTFESLYWQCPNLIKHIELNFRVLFRKYAKKFEKYSSNQVALLSKDYSSREAINKELKDAMDKKYFIEQNDKFLILNSFINGGRKVDDYTPDKIMQIYSGFILKEETSIEGYLPYNSVLYNVIQSLLEYKKYLKYKYLIDNAKKIYNEKDNYKKVSATALKAITKQEKKTTKTNKKIVKMLKSGKKNEKLESLVVSLNSGILELSKMYEDLDTNGFCEELTQKVTGDFTIEDVLKFMCSHYDYIYKTIKDTLEEEANVEEELAELKAYIYNPNNDVINNVTFLDETNIATIISDHYKLLNVNIPVESFENGEVDSIVDSINQILLYEAMQKNGMNREDIAFICEVNKKIDMEECI